MTAPAGAGLEAHLRLRRGRLALDVGLRAAAGAVTVLVGPNGAGKTTVVRALAGLEPLAAGSVVLAGEVLEDVEVGVRRPPERRPVGVVFQDYRLFPHLTALQNVAFGLRAGGPGLGRRAARRRAHEWLERVGVADHAGRRPEHLSGGEAQRVALARALAPEPRLLLLDEPMAALDASTRVEMRRLLAAQLASFPGVMVLVTHDPLEAVTLADELVVLEAGRVVQAGPAAEISARPGSRYVADLVGVNLFRGEWSGDRIRLPGGQALVVAATGQGRAFAVVHPRAVSLHRRRPEGTPRNVWPGAVDGLDFEGERVRVRVGGALPIVAEVTPAAVAELALRPGEPVWISVKAAEIDAYPR